MTGVTLARSAVIDDILARLAGVRQAGTGQWMALCPSHDDSTPSLSISEGGDGCVLLKCFVGCDVPAIMAALGREMRDLFPEKNPRRGNRASPKPLPPRSLGAGSPSPRPSPSDKYEIEPIGSVTEAQVHALTKYGYHFAPESYREAAAFAVRVTNRERGKSYTALGFKGFIGVAEGWKLWAVSEDGRLWRDERTGKLRRFNIGPADLIVARSLWNFSPVDRLTIMEGESDLLAYLELGDRNVITASCGAGNTSAFTRPDAAMWLRYKRPRRVFVYGDNDEAGRAGAEKRAEVLKGILPEARIFLPRLPEPVNDLRDLTMMGGK